MRGLKVRWLVVCVSVFLAGHSYANLVSATLPASRSVQVGDTATIFATVINTATSAVSDCGISLATSIDASSFFQTTNPLNNELTGIRNQTVAIAAGAAQTFLIGVTPNSVLAPTDVAFDFVCGGGSPAASFVGLNTLLLSASTTPVADIVTIALTPSGDGIAQLPKEAGLGFLSLATVNVGAGDNLNVTARVPSNVDGALLLCETDPATGACLSELAASLDLDINANGTPTFAVFASSELALSLDPAGRRLFVEFRDVGGAIRGSTSVAIAGGGPDIETRLAPDANGDVALPDSQAANQVEWILQQLAQSSTSIAEINEHFAVGTATGWQDFFNQLRGEGYNNAKILDLLWATPVSVGFVLGTGVDGAPRGFTQVRAEYARQQQITFFQVSPTGETVQFFDDQSLTMEQAADDFMATASENGLLVARVSSGGQCEPILARSATTPRALASVFKVWVLGGVAQAINDGVLSLADTIPLRSELFALGGTINAEPPGTLFSMQDMATLMLGISDNTATDHLHWLAGRERMDATVTDYGHATPNDMLPLLNISQHFSLYFNFSLQDALSYIDGTEAQQNTFLTDRILPIGSVLGGSTFNNEVLVDAFVKASPIDVCQTYASLREFPRESAGFELIDKALGSSAAQPNIRAFWDRVWYKGGSLEGNGQQRVLTHSWLLESAEKGRFVVVALANNPVSGDIDTFEVQSLTSRIIQLLRESI